MTASSSGDVSTATLPGYDPQVGSELSAGVRACRMSRERDPAQRVGDIAVNRQNLLQVERGDQDGQDPRGAELDRRGIADQRAER
jgi:hypothetical protein